MVKYSDMPKFTSWSKYTVFIQLNYLPNKIKEEIEELGLELKPDFQRGHDMNSGGTVHTDEEISRT